MEIIKLRNIKFDKQDTGQMKMNYIKELKDLQTTGLFKSQLYSFVDVREIIKLAISEKENNVEKVFHSNMKSKDWEYPDDWDSNKKSKQEEKEQ